uniref:Integrase, catalytic region, zinc finger, CCHC-type, peptidase aspartic, catalytic n=1 Tax=Tanacetum cinerariifolium TaxID=118510 RepID=A0A6L2KGI4_TANCI|nr:hypothetical protein [Tanacetum cinerariifolium]
MALGYQNPFYLKQAQKKQQSLYEGKVLLKKHDPPIVHDSEETLQLAQESREKMKQLNKEIKPANYTKINHLSGVFVSQRAKSREELYFSNDSKTANVSKSISIPNEEFSDDTTPSVAHKSLNEEVVKFVEDFKSLEKEANESLAKHKALELEIERLLRAVDITCGTSKNTKFAKQSILGKPPMLGEIHALSKPVTSNSVPTPQESEFVKNDKVIAPGIFRIKPFKTSREEKHVPNNIRASARTKPITISQPSVIKKKDVNSDSNGLSSTGIDNTKTRRPQPRSNTKNDRVPSVSKSSQSNNKGVKVEEHHRNLLLSKNSKHMLSACNNFKLDSQNVYSKVVYAMCKQCLISVNHDECLLNYVYDKNSRGKKQTANVSIKENQKKESRRWSPTGRMFDINDKIIASSESESQSDCSKGDNACTSNPVEPIIKWFPNATFFLAGTVRFRNDHVAAIMGFGDLQWGNILITRVYFVEELGHNLFSVGQFCDSDLEVAFRRNACFIRNLEGVDLLKGDRSTNLYTINLLEINDLVSCLPKFKYHKEHLFPSCEQGKSKRASHPPKPVPNLRQRLHLLHMDLCGPMRIASINGKRLKPRLQSMTSRQISSGLDLTYASSTITTLQPTKGELGLLFEAMYDDYIGDQPSATARTISAAQEPQVPQTAAESSSSHNVDPSNMHTFYQPYPYEFQWTKDHPLEQVIGELSRPVLTRNQFRSDGDMCMYALTMSTLEPKNVKEAMTDSAWIDSMQEELL